MKISIVTATFNASATLDNLIQSIASTKNEVDVEFIIIDGGSKDNTVEIIKKYDNIVDKWITEPDKGIYDAWNKGVGLANGDWIMFLGADDELLPGALNSYLEFLSLKPGMSYDLVSSRVEMVDENGKTIRIKGWNWEWPKFLKEVTIAHPGALHSKLFFQNYGLFDINYKITGDYELLLRPKDKLKAGFFNQVTVKMSEGGASDSVRAMIEHKRAAIATGGYSKIMANANFFTVFLKFKVKKAFRKLGLNVYLKR